MMGVGFAGPIALARILAKERSTLLDHLRGLSDSEWHGETLCTEWDVRQVAVCLLGSEESYLSPRRGLGLMLALRGDDPARARARLAEFTQEKQALHAADQPTDVLRRLETAGQRLERRVRRIPSFVWNYRVKHVGKRVPVSSFVASHLLEAWIHRQDIQIPRGAGNGEDREQLHTLILSAMEQVFIYGDFKPSAVVNVDLDWAGGWHVFPGIDRFQPGHAQRAAATVRLDPASFTFCCAGRLPHLVQSHVEIAGDAGAGRAFLEGIRFLGRTPGF